MRRLCTASSFPLTHKLQSNYFPPQPVWNVPQMNAGILTSSLQVTSSLGVLRASVTSRISCHCESSSDSLCCRLCLLWTAMLIEGLNECSAARGLRSHGGLCSKKRKKKPAAYFFGSVSVTTKQTGNQYYRYLFCVFCFKWKKKKVFKKDSNYFHRASETSRCSETSGVPCCQCADWLGERGGGSLPSVYLFQKHASFKKQRHTGSVYGQLKGSQ